MATFGNGTVVNAAVFNQAAVNGGVATYTVPASCYAIVNVGADSSTGNVSVTIAGATVASLANGGTFTANVFYVGPGQTITATLASHKATIAGVEFINSN